MAHEIKNPLTAIQAFAEYVPEKHRDPEFANKLHEILTTETRRIRRIVQDLLDFAKPKPPELKPIDPASLLTSTIELLSSELICRRIQWHTDYHHNGMTLQADPNQLRQVVINLIQNAADAMSEGGLLTLSTEIDDSYLKLIISDTGQGIPRELLSKIFDPFVSTKTDGNGLGLAMVYSIIQAHRGTISVKSLLGGGTTFTILLPLIDKQLGLV